MVRVPRTDEREPGESPVGADEVRMAVGLVPVVVEVR
jgi:hypothetical protein